MVPPSVEVRYWYPERPEPPVSLEPLAVTVADAAVDQAAEPPATAGAEGAVRSSLTVACVHGEASATPSTAANRTSVVPCAEIAALGPVVGDDHVLPPLTEVSYS